MRYMTEVKRALAQLENLRSARTAKLRELESCAETSLKASSGRFRKYYYARKRGEESYNYLGGDDNREVRKIREYRYTERLVRDLDSEIALLRALLEGHVDIGFDAVSRRLPAVYRDPAVRDYSAGLSGAAKMWKEQKEYEKRQYEKKKPENLIMRSIDGTLMRSKSEVIIANLLISNGIPFVYELPHIINGVLVYTDFTALSVDDFKTEVMIEHEGQMADPGYQRVFLNKVNSYLAEGMIPGRDVFFSFEDLHGGFDPSPVQDIIDARLKPRPLVLSSDC